VALVGDQLSSQPFKARTTSRACRGAAGGAGGGGGVGVGGGGVGGGGGGGGGVVVAGAAAGSCQFLITCQGWSMPLPEDT
jgi:hypothetical protein